MFELLPYFIFHLARTVHKEGTYLGNETYYVDCFTLEYDTYIIKYFTLL